MKKKIVFASVDFFKSTLAFILIIYPLYCYIKSQFILKLENDWFLGVIIWIFLILTGFVYLFSFIIKIIFFRNEIFISKRYVKFINYYVFFVSLFLFFLPIINVILKKIK